MPPRTPCSHLGFQGKNRACSALVRAAGAVGREIDVFGITAGGFREEGMGGGGRSWLKRLAMTRVLAVSLLLAMSAMCEAPVVGKPLLGVTVRSSSGRCGRIIAVGGKVMGQQPWEAQTSLTQPIGTASSTPLAKRRRCHHDSFSSTLCIAL